MSFLTLKMTRKFMSYDEKKKIPVKNIGTHFIYGGKNSEIISRFNNAINENEQIIAQKKHVQLEECPLYAIFHLRTFHLL